MLPNQWGALGRGNFGVYQPCVNGFQNRGIHVKWVRPVRIWCGRVRHGRMRISSSLDVPRGVMGSRGASIETCMRESIMYREVCFRA